MIKGADPQEWHSGSLCQVRHSKPARWWQRMRELTVEKKARDKQQLTDCGDRSYGLPSNSHAPDLPLGRMSHKHAWRSGSLQYMKQSVLTTEVISLFRPTTPSCCIIPVFYKMFLAYHGAHRITESVHSFRKRQGFSSTLCENSHESGKGSLVLGSCSSFLLRWDLHHCVHVHFINSCIPLGTPSLQH